MSDAVEILLSVDDQASTALAKAANKVSSIDRDANRARPSIISLEKAGRTAGDAIGRIGDTLDIPELGRASSAIGGIAEQLQTAKEASQGMKLGFVGTAGVIGGVAAASFSIGKAIGDVVFQTSMWEEKLKSALSISQQLADRQGRMADRAFGDQMARLDLADAPDSAYLELLRNIKQEQTGLSNSIAAELSKLDQMAGSAYHMLFQYESEVVRNNVNILQSQLEQLKEQETVIDRMLTVERELTKERERKSRAESEDKFIKQLQEELELITASADEQDRIIAARNAATIEGQAAIEMLLRSKRSAEANREADIAKREQAKLSSNPRRLTDSFTKLDGFESRLLTRGPQQQSSEELKELKNISKQMERQAKALEQSSQDMSMLIRNPLVIGAPGGRR